MNPSSTTNKPNTGVSGAASPDTDNHSRLQEGALCAWFVLVAAAFWGPYAGFALPFNILTALYAAFLLLFIAHAALRLLRQNEKKPFVPAAVKGSRLGK